MGWPGDAGLTDFAFQMRLLRELDQRGGNVGERFAAIRAADHAIDFEREVNIIGPAGINRHADDTHRKIHVAVFRRPGGGHLFPRIAAIFAAIQRHGCGARIQHVGLGRMVSDGIDINVAIREVGALPVCAGIGAAVGAILRANKQHARVVGMDRNRACGHILRQPLGDGFPLAITR